MGALVANGLIQKDALDIHRKLSISNHHSKTTRKDLPTNRKRKAVAKIYIETKVGFCNFELWLKTLSILVNYLKFEVGVNVCRNQNGVVIKKFQMKHYKMKIV